MYCLGFDIVEFEIDVDHELTVLEQKKKYSTNTIYNSMKLKNIGKIK